MFFSKYGLVFGFFLLLFSSFSAQGACVFNNTPYDPDLCLNGEGSTYMGACTCHNPKEVTGRYCTIATTGKCADDNTCPAGEFCAVFPKAHIKNCFPLIGRGPVFSQAKTFILSDSLLTHANAVSFCRSIGEGYRLASRKDFNCDDTGIGCLDTEILSALQEVFGYKLFFWLEAKENTTDAYYTDLNDGTVYYTSQENNATNQALCIQTEKK